MGEVWVGFGGGEVWGLEEVGLGGGGEMGKVGNGEGEEYGRWEEE